MNVLIAEDNASHRELLEVLIRSGEEGSQVTTVETGGDFVRHLRDKPYDVALLDYHLQDSDAPDLFPRIDEIPNHPPVIVVSSDGDSETIIATLRSGGRDFLPKTEAFQAAGLIARIRAVLRRRRDEQILIERQKDECIAALAGGLAHDFNNMLVGILGKAALLRDETNAERRTDYCDAIIRTGEGLAGLARQLLAYARGGKYSPKPLNLNEGIEDTLSMLKGAVSSRIQVRTFLSPNLWPVQADKSQIVQALLNLCLNGCEAMGREGTLSLFSENVSKLEPWTDDLLVHHPAGDYVHVVVADTGCGIADSIRSTMFEPYHSTKGDGRGLGLAAVKGIVKTHGGALVARSTPGRGSAFHLFLPRIIVAAPLPPATIDNTSTPAARILVVEDEPEVRELVGEILAGAGHRVALAENGEQAVAAMRADAGIELVLLDMRLPDCSGLDLLRLFRKERPGLRVVLFSGYERMAVMEEVLAEFEDVPFLSKPFLPQALLKTIGGALVSR